VKFRDCNSIHGHPGNGKLVAAISPSETQRVKSDELRGWGTQHYFLQPKIAATYAC
jgi:hypothetical protein